MFKFGRHGFLREILMLENPDYLWQPYIWTYISQILLLVALCLRPEGAFNLPDLEYQ